MQTENLFRSVCTHVVFTVMSVYMFVPSIRCTKGLITNFTSYIVMPAFIMLVDGLYTCFLIPHFGQVYMQERFVILIP